MRISSPQTRRLRHLLAGWLCFGMVACQSPQPARVLPPGVAPSVEIERLMHHVYVLAADSLEGRRTGTVGAERARRYITSQLQSAGVAPHGGRYAHPFSFESERLGRNVEGVNVLGVVEGQVVADSFVVVTAHYDHEGLEAGVVYNGADDNASGVAVLLEAARGFAQTPPRYSFVFAALDAEEIGLLGARALLRDAQVPPERILLNVNMDMVSRSDAGELYAAGTYHTPALRGLLEPVAARSPIHLRFGHDTPDLGRRGDWTLLSDHAPFHRMGIPFVYFGVEDHPDYHRPTDDPDRIPREFYLGAARTIYDALRTLDAGLPLAPIP